MNGCIARAVASTSSRSMAVKKEQLEEKVYDEMTPKRLSRTIQTRNSQRKVSDSSTNTSKAKISREKNVSSTSKLEANGDIGYEKKRDSILKQQDNEQDDGIPQNPDIELPISKKRHKRRNSSSSEELTDLETLENGLNSKKSKRTKAINGKGQGRQKKYKGPALEPFAYPERNFTSK